MHRILLRRRATSNTWLVGVFAGAMFLMFGAARAEAFVSWGTVDGRIARANLDGSRPDQRFIATAGPTAIAVDGLAAAGPSSAFSFAGKALRRNGFTILRVTIPGPGIVSAAQLGVTQRKPALVRAVRVKAAKAGKATLTLRPTPAGRKRLAAKRRFTVKTKVSYTPTGGEPGTAVKPVVLARVKYIR
jgi:hypothetical protein